MELRNQNALHLINKNQKGLEIGPLHQPIAPKREGYDIKILDHCSAKELMKKYTGHGFDVKCIEDVDYIWKGESYRNTIGEGLFFDYIIASHVIEHTPDLIGFLKNCEDVLNHNGIISLVIPDKMCCFDYFRPITGIAKIIDAHYNKNTLHSIGTMSEYFLNVVNTNNHIAWDKNTTEFNFNFVHHLGDVKNAKDVYEQKQYVDFHSWVFTPYSFRLLIHDLNALGYISFCEVAFFETNGCEFYLTLQKNAPLTDFNRLDILKKIGEESQSIKLPAKSLKHQIFAKEALVKIIKTRLQEKLVHEKWAKYPKLIRYFIYALKLVKLGLKKVL